MGLKVVFGYTCISSSQSSLGLSGFDECPSRLSVMCVRRLCATAQNSCNPLSTKRSRAACGMFDIRSDAYPSTFRDWVLECGADGSDASVICEASQPGRPPGDNNIGIQRETPTSFTVIRIFVTCPSQS